IAGGQFGVKAAGGIGPPAQAIVTNYGLITGFGTTGGGGVGVYLGHGGIVQNGSGTNTGTIVGYGIGILAANNRASVFNAGTIIGSINSGVALRAGGLVVNYGDPGTISGYFTGVYAGGVATIENGGTIIATGTVVDAFSRPTGVYLKQGG